MEDLEAKKRTYNILAGIDQLMGVIKADQAGKQDAARLKLANAIVWIRKNLDIDALDGLFQECKSEFKHLKSIKDLIWARTGEGLHFDVIDRMIIYREANGDELQEIIRIEKDGMFYFKGGELFRDRELYDALVNVVES